MAPRTRATTSNAPRMYLLAANHDSDCSAELKNGTELSETGAPAGTLEAAASEEEAIAWASLPSPTATIAAEAETSIAAVMASAGAGLCGAARTTCGSELASSRHPSGGSRRTPAAGCGSTWPRHCFSSHSTQKIRSCDTGKPQAWHFCSFLNTGGTGVNAAALSGWLLPSLRRASDQKSGFFGAAPGFTSS